MTTRCYEELQAKLENQEQLPVLSRETTLCTTKKIVYYEKSKLPDGLQLPTISNIGMTLNNALTNVYI